MLHSKLKEDMRLGSRVGFLGGKVNLAVLIEVGGEKGDLTVACMRGVS